MAVSSSNPKRSFRLTTVGEAPSACSQLAEGISTVGSQPGSTIHLPTAGVSREHAEIEVRGDHIWLKDLGSKNGTFLNDLRTERAPIQAGDRVRFGPVSTVVDRVAEGDAELALPGGAFTPVTHCDVVRDETRSVTALEDTPSAISSQTPTELSFPVGYVVGRSQNSAVLHDQLRCLAPTRLPVLILGETGVGKELAARTLHLSSERSEGPFVALNCAAIPCELLESELFGIEAGVASGVTRREGKILGADGGTLFLDEIGDMAPPLQAKLLRVLQEMEIEPVGARRSQAVDVRVIAATNTELRRNVDNGSFRADLFYRIAGVTVCVPPLRDRREDVPQLVEHLLKDHADEVGRSAPGMTVAALNTLVDAPWPGNIRQLAHEIGRLIQVCPHDRPIDSSMLSEDLFSSPPQIVATPTTGSLADQVEALERTLINNALESESGNRSRAATALGLSRNGLLKKMKRYGLDG